MSSALRATCFVIVLVICSLPLLLFHAIGGGSDVVHADRLFLAMVMIGVLWAAGGSIGLAFLVSTSAYMIYGFGSIFYGSGALNRPIITNALYFSIPVSLVVSIYELFQKDRSACQEYEPKNEDQSKN